MLQHCVVLSSHLVSILVCIKHAYNDRTVASFVSCWRRIEFPALDAFATRNRLDEGLYDRAHLIIPTQKKQCSFQSEMSGPSLSVTALCEEHKTKSCMIHVATRAFAVYETKLVNSNF